MAQSTSKPSGPLRDTGKTTYLLGAGFSAMAGVPVQSKFLPRAFEMLKESDHAGDRELAKDLANVIIRYASLAGRINIDLDNLEHMFCLADLPSNEAAARGQRRPSDSNVLKKVIVRVSAEAIRRHCEACHHTRSGSGGSSPRGSITESLRCESVPRRHLFTSQKLGTTCRAQEAFGVCIYEAFLSYVLYCQSLRKTQEIQEMDAIITFNYDLVIEQAVRAFSKAKIYYGNKVVQTTNAKLPWLLVKWPNGNDFLSLPLIKLHGSINWENNGKEGSSVIVHDTSRIDEQFPGRGWNKIESVPLVPPTWQSLCGPNSIFEKMTRQAIDHLQRASRIIIIGYSMPPSDFDFRFLLVMLATPEWPSIQVYDIKPREEMLPRLHEMFGAHNVEQDRVQYFNTGLKGFVFGQVSPDIAEPHGSSRTGIRHRPSGVAISRKEDGEKR